jgi:predicted Zn-dependent peptidase
MARVTADDIVEAARRVLTPDAMVLAAVGALSKARVGELREVVTGWR